MNRRRGPVLVLSPHLDDGVLSCGASMACAAERGDDVVVATFFAGSPGPDELTPAGRAYHESCGLGDDAIAARTIEDAAALAAVGARAVRFELHEALYRRDAGGAPVYSSTSIFGAASGPEPSVVDELVALTRTVVAEVDPTVVVYPLAVGGHVDHVALRLAAARCRSAEARRSWLAFEDVPYVLFPWHAGWEGELGPLRGTASPVSRRQWEAKVQAIGCYASQHHVLFVDPGRWPEELERYGRAVGGGQLAERFWTDA